MSRNKSILDDAVKAYLEEKHVLHEGRSAPGGLSVGDFEKDVKSHIISQFDDAPGNLEGSNKIGIQGSGEQIGERIREEIEEYITDQFGAEVFDERPVLLEPRRQPQTENGELWTDVYEATSGVGSSSYYGVWTVINNSVFYWKLSGSESKTSSLTAADYELAICTGYNIYQDQNSEDNPFVDVNGNLDPFLTVSEEEIRPYVEGAVEGSASDAQVNTAIEGIDVGLGIILRNSGIQNRGDRAIQFGAGSVSTSSQYQGTDNTPKTDFYFSDGTQVSLKKQGASQLMSGQAKDARAVFEGAMAFFSENEQSAKRKIKEEVISSFEKDMDKIDRPTKSKTITSIKNEALSAYKETRVEELRNFIENEVRSEDRIELETYGGKKVVFERGDDPTPELQNHVKAELKHHGILNRSGRYEERLIEVLVIDRKELLQRIDRQFGEEEIDRIDENAKQVLKRLIDHDQITETVKEIVEGKNKAGTEFGKWVVFEAATGMYKFDGPSNSPFQNLKKASRPVANSYLVFDEAAGEAGKDKFADITEDWASSKASGINIRVSFKTRSSGFYSTLRLEDQSEEVEKSPLTQIVENEKEKMFEDIRKQVVLRQKVYKVVNNERDLHEDVFGYDVSGAIRKALERGKDIMSYIADRFKKFVRSVVDRLKTLVDEALNRGVKDLLNLLGIEIEKVHIDPIEV